MLDYEWGFRYEALTHARADGVAVYEVLPDVAANYSGVTGGCLLDDYGDRIEMDYDIWGYFEVEGEPQCLKSGFYNATTGEIAWDEDLMPSLGDEGG